MRGDGPGNGYLPPNANKPPPTSHKAWRSEGAFGEGVRLAAV